MGRSPNQLESILVVGHCPRAFDPNGLERQIGRTAIAGDDDGNGLSRGIQIASSLKLLAMTSLH
jgi:hypothetical protein